MPTYEFESGTGKRVEMYFKLRQRPEAVELGGEKYYPVITKVNTLLVSAARDQMSDEEMLDENIKTALKKFEGAAGTNAIDQMHHNSRVAKRVLDDGPIQVDPDEEKKLAELAFKEQEAIARGDVDPGYHDLPEEDLSGLEMVEVKGGEVAGKSAAPVEIQELMRKSGSRFKEGKEHEEVIHA